MDRLCGAARDYAARRDRVSESCPLFVAGCAHKQSLVCGGARRPTRGANEQRPAAAPAMLHARPARAKVQDPRGAALTYSVSYVPSEAREEAARITHDLTEHGESWLDTTERDASDDTSEDWLDVRVASSQCFLVILTPGYFKSPSLRALQCALWHNVTVLSCYPSRYSIANILNEAPDVVIEIRSIVSRKIDIRRAPRPTNPCTRLTLPRAVSARLTLPRFFATQRPRALRSGHAPDHTGWCAGRLERGEQRQAAFAKRAAELFGLSCLRLRLDVQPHAAHRGGRRDGGQAEPRRLGDALPWAGARQGGPHASGGHRRAQRRRLPERSDPSLRQGPPVHLGGVPPCPASHRTGAPSRLVAYIR